MRAIELETEIDENHELHLRLPADIQAGRARVIVLLEETKPQEPITTESTLAMLERLGSNRTWPIRTKDEIDRALAEERENWERDQ